MSILVYPKNAYVHFVKRIVFVELAMCIPCSSILSLGKVGTERINYAIDPRESL